MHVKFPFGHSERHYKRFREPLAERDPDFRTAGARAGKSTRQLPIGLNADVRSWPLVFALQFSHSALRPDGNNHRIAPDFEAADLHLPAFR